MISLLVYLFFYLSSFFFYLYTTSGVTFAPASYHALQQGVYTTEVILIILAAGLICRMETIGKKAEHGILAAATLLELQVSAVYLCAPRTNATAGLLDVIQSSSCLPDLVLMFLAFIVTYGAVSMGIHRLKAVGCLSAVGVLLCIFGAKLFSPTNGSHLYFLGVMVFAEVFVLYPFAAAYFCSLSNDRYVFAKASRISYNSVLFLAWNFLIYFGCVLNNEFGLLLIVALTSSILFCIKEKDLIAKLIYTLSCAFGGIAAMTFVRHLSTRFQILLDPGGAYQTEGLREQASSIIYLFKHCKTIGFYGMGAEHVVSSSYFPTRLNDHILVLIFENFSVLIVLAVLFAGMLLVRWLLTEDEGMSTHEKYLNLICGLLTGFTLLLNVISCTFITIGVGYPLLSKTGSINTAFMVLIAIHTALLDKEGDCFDDYEEETC